MKNVNHNASVADWYRSVGSARQLVESYRILVRVLYDSECEEMWPKEGRKDVKDESPVYQITWNLYLDPTKRLTYQLRIVETATRVEPALSVVPVEVLKRFTQLREALEDFMHRGGDYPNPHQMPGGIQLQP